MPTITTTETMERPVATLRLTNYEENPNITDLRNTARSRLENNDISIPIMNEDNDRVLNDTGIISELNNDPNSLSLRREILSAMSNRDFRPDLFESIIESVSPQMSEYLRTILGSSLSNPQAFLPILNITSIAFGLGFDNTGSIVGAILNHLPDIEGNDYDEIQQRISQIREETNAEIEESAEEAKESIENRGEEGRNERVNIFTRHRLRLMLGAGAFATTGIFLLGFGPQLYSSISSVGLLQTTQRLFDPTIGFRSEITEAIIPRPNSQANDAGSTGRTFIGFVEHILNYFK